MKAKKISPHVARGQLAWLEALAAFEQDLFAHGRSRATIATYASAVRTFGQFYCTQLGKPGPYVSRLHAADLHAFIDHLRRERQLSAASVNRFVAALHSFVRCGLAHKWLRRDIARKLRTYHVSPAGEPITLRPLEVRRLLAAPDPHRRNGLRDQMCLLTKGGTTMLWRLSSELWISAGEIHATRRPTDKGFLALREHLWRLVETTSAPSSWPSKHGRCLARPPTHSSNNWKR